MSTRSKDLEIQNWQDANPLKVWRERKQMTMSTLANRIGVTPKTVQFWERGLTQPTERNLERIASAIEMTSRTLVHKWQTWLGKRPE